VEEKLVELARRNTDALLAVAASGQNLDRLVSCFRAAKRSGRQLVIDPYQAYVLTKLASLSPNVPQFTWETDVSASCTTRCSASWTQARPISCAR
jgi:ribonuclease J